MASFIMGVLALYRVSFMVTREDGPFEVFTGLRSWVFNRWGNGWQNDGVNCILCVSWWLSWFVAALLPVANIRTYVLSAMGLSGSVLILHNVLAFLRIVR